MDFSPNIESKRDLLLPFVWWYYKYDLYSFGSSIVPSFWFVLERGSFLLGLSILLSTVLILVCVFFMKSLVFKLFFFIFATLSIEPGCTDCGGDGVGGNVNSTGRCRLGPPRSIRAPYPLRLSSFKGLRRNDDHSDGLVGTLTCLRSVTFR